MSSAAKTVATAADGEVAATPLVTGARSAFRPTFCFWMVLLLAQSFLIDTRRTALHRSAGTFGIGVGPQILHWPLAGSAAFASFTSLLTDLVYYR